MLEQNLRQKKEGTFEPTRFRPESASKNDFFPRYISYPARALAPPPPSIGGTPSERKREGWRKERIAAAAAAIGIG